MTRAQLEKKLREQQEIIDSQSSSLTEKMKATVQKGSINAVLKKRPK